MCIRDSLTASFYNYTYSATYRTATPYYFKVEDGSSLNPDGTANLITNSIGDTGTTYLTSTDGNGGHRRYALQASLNYARKFGKHDVGAMFVYRMNEKKNNIAGTSEENLLPYREQGMAGRVTYGFDNRYLFEASFGYNGSENFAPGKRWGFFPSAAAGWVISNESFWDGIRKTVSNLKIRVSYGLAGNDALGERFPYRSIVAMGEESGFYYNWNSQGKGPKITTYGNPNATWEEAKKLDVGLELGLFNALNIEAAYFTEDRTGIFMRRTSLPSSTGLLGVTPYGNIGRVKSHGVDLSAVYNKQFNKDWSLSLRGTFTFSRNEVVEKDEGDLMYDYMSVVGHPVNAITGVLVADGLFTSQEEIDNSPKQQFGNYTVGDIKYRDLNGDGKISYVMFKGQEGNLEAIARTKYGVEDCNKLLTAAGKPELSFYDASNSDKYLVDQDGQWSSAAATNYMSTILAQYSEANNNMVELVIANNDDMALGAISALQAAGYNTGSGKVIPIFGVDATDAGKSAIKSGAMTGTIRQDGDGMASTIFTVMNNLRDGKGTFEGVDSENVVGTWRVNIPYSEYTGE